MCILLFNSPLQQLREDSSTFGNRMVLMMQMYLEWGYPTWNHWHLGLSLFFAVLRMCSLCAGRSAPRLATVTCPSDFCCCCLLDYSNTSPFLWQQKLSLNIAQCPLTGKTSPGINHWAKKIKASFIHKISVLCLLKIFYQVT